LATWFHHVLAQGDERTGGCAQEISFEHVWV
jgi:hypothetical protein